MLVPPCCHPLQVSKALTDGELRLADADIVRVDNYVCNNVGGEQMLMVSGLQLLHSSGDNDSKAPADGSTDAAGAKPDQQAATPAAAAVKQEPRTPVAVKPEAGQVTPAVAQRPTLTPGPTPSPSEE